VEKTEERKKEEEEEEEEGEGASRYTHARSE
jgi:hypothetical protein